MLERVLNGCKLQFDDFIFSAVHGALEHGDEIFFLIGYIDLIGSELMIFCNFNGTSG